MLTPIFDESETLFNLGAIYEISDASSLFLQYAEGFRQHLGRSINESIRDQRVERAKEVLRDTEAPIRAPRPIAKRRKGRRRICPHRRAVRRCKVSERGGKEGPRAGSATLPQNSEARKI